MTIQLGWGDFDETVLLANVSGNWTCEEFHNAVHDFIAQANAAHGNIEVMIDMRQSLKPPKNLITMIRSVARLKLPKNTLQVIVISQTSFWERMFSSLDTMIGERITIPIIFVKTVDEAYTRLIAFAEAT